MGRFKMPKNAAEILNLVDDANRVHDEKVKLELLVNGMLEDGKASSKSAKSPYARPPTDKKSPSAPSPWSSAMSVDALSKKAASKPNKPSSKPASKVTDSDDSDNEPLPMKPKPGAKGVAKDAKKKKIPKEEKKFKGMTAYNVFVGHESNRLRDICKEKGSPIVTPEDKKEMMSKVGELWKALDAEKRVKWQKIADERNVAKLAARELGKVVEAPAAANGGAAASGDGAKVSEAEGSDDE